MNNIKPVIIAKAPRATPVSPSVELYDYCSLGLYTFEFDCLFCTFLKSENIKFGQKYQES